MNETFIDYIIQSETVSKDQKDNYMYELENELYGDDYSNNIESLSDYYY